METAVCILDLYDEGINCAKAVKEIINNPNIDEQTNRYEIAADSPFLSFACVLNAELAFMNKAYLIADDQFASCEGQLNPIAKCHSDISRMCKAMQYLLTSVSPDDIKSFADGFPL